MAPQAPAARPPAGARRRTEAASRPPALLLLPLLLLAAAVLLLAGPATAKAPAASATRSHHRSSSSSITTTWGRWRRHKSSSTSTTTHPRPSSRLFHDDENSLSWDSPALQRLKRNAKGDHLRDLDSFLAAPSLAAFLGLDPVEALHVPLPVNVVLIGFQGDGHVGVDLPATVIKDWLARGLDHVLPHTRVALADLSCAEDGHCLGRLDASAATPPSPLPSVVRLNASVTVAAVARGEVLHAFDRAVAAFSRPVDPAEPLGAQQVDALKMDAFVESFVEALGFADSGYTLLVLNPNWSQGLAAYSYRAGFTTEEIEQLHGQLELLHEVSRQATEEEPAMPRLRPPPLKRPPNAAQASGGKASSSSSSGADGQLSAAAREAAAARVAIVAGEKGVAGASSSWKKFRAVDAGEASAVWAKAATKYLDAEEAHRRELIRLVGPRTMGGAAAARAVSLLRQAQGRGRWALPSLHSSQQQQGGGVPPDGPTSSVASRYAEEGRLLAATLALPPDHVHNPDLRASHPLEDCATPTWVGLGRWILLDLTAHRSDWGPALGGDGVVTAHTLPDVAEAMAPVIQAREDVRESRTYSTAQVDLHEKLSIERDASRASVENAQAHARALNEAVASNTANAQPPAATPPQLDADGNPILNADNVAPATPLPHHTESEHEREQHERRNEAAVLRAELDAVERFALEHCHGRAEPPPACDEAREAAAEIWHDLLLRSTSSGEHVHGGHREHRWDIFGDLDLRGEQHAAVVAPAVEKAAGRLLPHLAAVLSSGLRHAVAPPSATWHHRGYLHDTASPYARRVRFRVHLVRDGTRQAMPGTVAHEKQGLMTGRAPASSSNAGAAMPLSLARPPPYLTLSSFDVAAFKQQVSRLALPKQRFEFEVVEVALHDEPGLAAAFAASTRGAFASVPHAVDDPVENESVYVDSRELAARLRARFGGANARRFGGAFGGGGFGGGGMSGGPALRRVQFNADADPTGFFGGGADVWAKNKGSKGARPAGAFGGDDRDSAAADGFGGGFDDEDDDKSDQRGPWRGTNPHAVLDVPVFVFVLDRPHPVLLDAHYNARALEDMVLAVSNTAHEDEPPLGVSCDGYLLSRPPSPLRHTLAAVLQHLGGVLPPHLGFRPASSASSPYDDAAGDESDGGAGLSGAAGGGGSGGDGGDSADNGGASLPSPSSSSSSSSSSTDAFSGSGGRIEHDWLWATGAHPLAWTGSGASYSQLSVDALHRSYVLDALDSSVDTANRAMHRLDAADARRRKVAAAQALLAREAADKKGGERGADGGKGSMPSLLEEWADALAAGDERGLVVGGVKSGKDRARRRRNARAVEKHGGELLMEREHAHLVAHSALARRALERYSELAELWRRAAAHAAALDFGPAAEAIPRIERAAWLFERACLELEEALFPKRCAARHGRGLPPGLKWAVVWGMAAGGAAVAALALGLPQYARLKVLGKHAKGA